MNVDNLAVHQVLLQVEVVTLLLQRNQLARRAQFKRARGRLHYFFRGHNKQPGARLQHQPSHFARIRSRCHSHILQPPPKMPLRIGHRRAEHRRQADAGCSAWLHEVSVFPRGPVWTWRCTWFLKYPA